MSDRTPELYALSKVRRWTGDHDLFDRLTLFGQHRELIDLPDLRKTLLFLKTVDRPLEKVRVRREPCALGDAIVILQQ